jgi:hypothetical protein
MWRKKLRGFDLFLNRGPTNLKEHDSDIAPDASMPPAVRGVAKQSVVLGSYHHTIRGTGNAFRQTHIPTAFTLVHLENQTGVRRRMVPREVNQEKIRPHLPDWNRTSVDEQAHRHLGGMSTLT